MPIYDLTGIFTEQEQCSTFVDQIHMREFCTNELSLALDSGRKWPSPLSASHRGHSCLQEHKAIEDIRNSNEQSEQTTEWAQDWTQETHHRLTLHRS